MALRILDLFSGIGGFSIALHSIAKTVGYCEIDDNCRKVLEKNMRLGNLDKAPIFHDVTKLSKQDLQQIKPNMITAGFPCQDISVANPNGKGLDGEKSGLFSEIIRLVDLDPNIKYVFMENSSQIIDKGYDYIASQFRMRGFVVKYTLLRASDMGAVHKRLRWYCLCYKAGSDKVLKQFIIPEEYLKFNWINWKKYKTVIPISSKQHKMRNLVRCKMLGNSIVPQCCMHAWNTLIHDKGKVDYVRSTPYNQRSARLDLVFTDGHNTIVKPLWATPVHSIWHNYSHLTSRGSTLLSNQSYYYEKAETHLLDKLQHYNKYITNPVFVECLMGYTKGWTKL